MKGAHLGGISIGLEKSGRSCFWPREICLRVDFGCSGGGRVSIFFGRYVLSRSPIWGEPFSLLCLVWISLLGSALAVRNDEHLRVTMFDEKLGKKGLISTEILSTACIVVFSVFLIYYGSALTRKGAINNMAGINVPYSVMYISMPVTGVLNLFGVVGKWMERGAAK